MNDDLMRRLRAADPAARLGLVADDAMREAIMTTDLDLDVAAREARSRRRRRAVISGGLATLLVGGGVAYAAVVSSLRGGHDGVVCVNAWDQPEADDLGGPLLTGDPVADCARYQELAGLPPMVDPVAFRQQGALFVAPRDQAPADAVMEVADDQAEALRELEASLHDEVDGPATRCLDEQEALSWARVELDRLGLDDWKVRTQDRHPEVPPGECASIEYAYDAPDEETFEVVPRTLAVIPQAVDDPAGYWDDADPFLQELVAALRERVAESCVDLGTAEAIAAEVIGGEHHWPTTALEDPDAECTRVDLEVGGSIAVTLRGPRG